MASDRRLLRLIAGLCVTFVLLLFQFEILPEAGFSLYGPNVRAYKNQILKVLEDPCLGQRLRQPPDAPEAEYRWDDFCKLDLPRGLRLIYIWSPADCYITIVKFGPHLGHGQLGDVYDGLARMFDLTHDTGHAQLLAEPCCNDTASATRTVSVDEGTDQILRMTKR